MTARIQLAGMALAALLGASSACNAADSQTTGNFHEATLAEYRQHLVELNGVVAACAKARDTKSCDPALVGLRLRHRRRVVRNHFFAERAEWLRVWVGVSHQYPYVGR